MSSSIHNSCLIKSVVLNSYSGLASESPLMKSFILLLIASASAIHIKNKDFSDYFTEGPKVYSKGAHWRKKWPEGAVDTSEDDPNAEFDIIDRFNHPVPPKEDPQNQEVTFHCWKKRFLPYQQLKQF